MTAKKYFHFFCSIKVAVVILLALTTCLATATFLESAYDAKTAQQWVYRSWYFISLLGILGLEILAVALSRWPWRFKHIPFLLAHLGIILLLIGAAISQSSGVQGYLRVIEGQTSRLVETDEEILTVVDMDSQKQWDFFVPWQASNREFSEQVVKVPHLKLPLKIQGILRQGVITKKYLAREKLPYSGLAVGKSVRQYAAALVPQGKFLENMTGARAPSAEVKPPSVWVSNLSASESIAPLGPVRLIFGHLNDDRPGPWISLEPLDRERIQFRAKSPEGQTHSEIFSSASMKNRVLNPRWKSGMEFRITDWIENPQLIEERAEAKISGQGLPMLQLHTGEFSQWLDYSVPLVSEFQGHRFRVMFSPRRFEMPFEIKLLKFNLAHNMGTETPASYTSTVQVIGANTEAITTANHPESFKVITMNEPLTVRSLTFYQASYDKSGKGRAYSVFAVNYDPGRFLKYFGSILIILGSILLFSVKAYRGRKGAIA